MSDPGKAVFLSYASQDAEAARRICDALRAAGVEVWFDQSELVGGDAWDQKIRKQIRDCALLIPVISASTQARHEGYFRLEWRLADQRTHLMGRSKAFLLPVSIDGTRDADADVPDSFVAVQWTKAPDGAVPPAFVARVKQLLDGQVENGGGALRPDSTNQSGHSSVAKPMEDKKAPPTQTAQRWLKPALGAAVVAAIALAIAQPWKKPAPLVPAVAPARGNSESEQLVAKAWKQLNEPGMARAELEIADELCRRATEIDPESSDAWAAWSFVDSGYCYHALGNTLERREGARAKAARALQLSPSSFEARLAQANYLVCDGSDASISMFAPEAERLLRALLHERPTEPRTLLAFALLQRNLGHFDEARQALQTMALNPAAAVLAWAELAWVEIHAGQPARALEWENRSIAVQPVRSNLTGKMMLLASWEGNLEDAMSVLGQIPATAMQEDYTASVALQVMYWRRDSSALLRLAGSIPREWLQSNWFRGPLAWWKGLAEQQAGNSAGARVQWLAAMKLVERRLADAPSSPELIAWKGRLHAQLGEKAEAEKALDLAYQMGMKGAPVDRWHDEILRGRPERVLDEMDAALRAGRTFWAATFRLAPQYDPIRAHPRFRAFQAQLDGDPRCNPRAPAKTDMPAGAGPDSKSVAVLAFANLSDDKANEYFSDGISEELLNVLAKVPGLKVTARTSSFHFKGKDTSISEIAQQLGVAFVIEGSVRKQGDKVRITAQLIKAADGFHVWSDTFTRDLKDIFAVQDEIAGLIADKLSLKLGMRSAAATASVSPEAFQLYVQGRQAWGLRTNEGFDLAEQLLNRALALAPDFARAHAALADVAVLRAIVGESIGRYDQRNSPEQARLVAQIQRVLALDPDLAEARATLGFTLKYGWDFAGGERELRRAVALNPNYATGHHWLGGLLLCTGQMDDALAELKLASELDPLSSRILDNYGGALFAAGRYQEALAVQNRALALQSNSRQALAGKAWILLALGRTEEAVALVRQLPSGNSEAKVGILAQAGLKTEAEAVFAQLEAKERTWGMLLALGRPDEALAALENSASISTVDANDLFFDPITDAIRGDSRFAKCLATFGWTEAHARAQAWRVAHPPEKISAK